MRLVSYQDGAGWSPGVVVEDRVLSLAEVASRAGLSSGAGAEIDWHSTRGVLGSPVSLAEIGDAAETSASDGVEGTALAAATLGPPVPDPEKIIGVGLNYRDHAAEAGLDIPTTPTLFPKFANSLAAHGQQIEIPESVTDVDYEGELAVVIGDRCRDAEAADALDHVAGCMPFNDLSSRALQFSSTQWMAGKAIDLFAPCGPWLTSIDTVERIDSLQIKTEVNSDIVQEEATSSMIFGVPELIAYLSAFMTLEPGDIIATGTPAGVGLARDPQLYLGDGDVVRVEIGGLGVLENEMIRIGNA